MSKELVLRIERSADIVPRLAHAETLINRGLQAGAVEIALRHPKESRTLDQNRRLWAVLSDVASQVIWYGRKLPSEAWKDIFTASLERQDVVPGLDGGFVMIGGRTSKMSKKRFADLLTLIDAFGTEHNVRWSDPALKAFAEYKEAIA